MRGTNSSVFNDLLNVYENDFKRKLSVEGYPILSSSSSQQLSSPCRSIAATIIIIIINYIHIYIAKLVIYFNISNRGERGNKKKMGQ